jgi:hypothetical protein
MIWPRAKYALKALVALARIEGSAMIGDIARPYRIPHKFLEQILLDLKREGPCKAAQGDRAAMRCCGPLTKLPLVRSCGSLMVRLRRCHASAAPPTAVAQIATVKSGVKCGGSAPTSRNRQGSWSTR